MREVGGKNRDDDFHILAMVPRMLKHLQGGNGFCKRALPPLLTVFEQF